MGLLDRAKEYLNSKFVSDKNTDEKDSEKYANNFDLKNNDRLIEKSNEKSNDKFNNVVELMSAEISKSDQLAEIKKNPWFIKTIENPDKELKMAALAVDGNVIELECFKNADKDMQLQAVKTTPESVLKMKNPLKEVKLEALNRKGELIEFFNAPDKDEQHAAVTKNPWNAAKIKNIHEDIMLEVVKKDGNIIKCFDKPPKKVQMAAVHENPFAIKHIYNPDNDVQRECAKGNIEAVKEIRGIVCAEVQEMVISRIPTECTGVRKEKAEMVKMDPVKAMESGRGR